MAFKRVAWRFEINILRQGDGQLILGHGHDPARIAMNEGDRGAPIALARNTPVAQAPHGRPLAPAASLGAGDHIGLGIFDGFAVKEVRIDDHAVAGFRLTAHRCVGLRRVPCHHTGDRQGVFARKLKIALIVPRHAHHRAGAVIHQHKIGDEHRHVCPSEGMPCRDFGAVSQLFRGFERGGSGPAFLALFDEGRDRGISAERLRDRVVGSDGAETRAEDRVGPRGVNRQPCTIGQVKTEFQPLRLADPVFLHQLHLVGPMRQFAQPIQQVFGKIGDLEEPLVKLALFHFRTRPPALPVDHLLIGEHGHVDRIPIDLA